MPLETTLWDPAARLTSPEAEAAYLEAAFEDGDPAIIVAALGDVVRARGLSYIARDTGLSRETLYRAFRAGGNPTLETLSRVARSLGYRFALLSAHEAAS